MNTDQTITGLVDGTKVPKNDLRMEICGTIDEISSFLGLAATTADEKTKGIIKTIQKDLIIAGTEVASLPTSIKHITEDQLNNIIKTEQEIKKQLPEQTSFILPGGTQTSAYLHVARATTRRAERTLTTLNETMPINNTLLNYINKLSDLLYQLARYTNK
jgi:cob(I)alamin adenosyltransferase